MRMLLKITVFVLLLQSGSLYAQKEWSRFSTTDEDSKTRATEQLELIAADLDFGVRECLCDCDFKLESSIDSEWLFVNKGKLKLIRTKDEVVWRFADWQKETLADDRPDPKPRTTMITCGFEQLFIDGKYYNNKSVTLRPDESNARYRLYMCPLINPLHVPFLHYSCFLTSSACNGAQAAFGGLTKCVATASKGKALESIWLDKDATGKSFAFSRSLCVNGAPERFEYIAVPNGFYFEKDGLPPLKECRGVCSTETKWGTFEGSAVPISTIGVMESSLVGAKMLHFEASMKYHDRNSKEYSEKIDELNPIIETITKRDKKPSEEPTKP